MSSRQRRQLMAPRQNECIRDNDDTIGPLLDQSRKCIIHIVLAADLEYQSM
jgi:hypothetical protein